ncbi:hypothetical protein ERO13_D01G150275v2 [Gossypium hirsutum]|nr:hypothetical protein ERO13_D01G150275v2 [Gossypium hirsutum]
MIMHIVPFHLFISTMIILLNVLIIFLRGYLLSGKGGICFCGGIYICWKDSCSRICICFGIKITIALELCILL